MTCHSENLDIHQDNDMILYYHQRSLHTCTQSYTRHISITQTQCLSDHTQTTHTH